MEETTDASELQLSRILDGAARVYAAVQDRKMVTAPARRPPWQATPWLTTSRVEVTFRTRKAANHAGVQFATRGYSALVNSRAVVVKAPWFLISAVITNAGVGTEVLGIRCAGVRMQRVLGSLPSARHD